MKFISYNNEIFFDGIVFGTGISGNDLNFMLHDLILAHSKVFGLTNELSEVDK